MQTATKIDLSRSMNVLRSYLMTVASNRWTTQPALTEWTGLSGVTVRQVCQAYPAMFVSSKEGYKLATYATTYEIQRCVSTLISRSEKMIHRAAALSGRLA